MDERKVKDILRVHINAAAPHQSNEGVVDACYEKLKAGGYLVDGKGVGFDKKRVVEKLGNGTAYEGE